MLYCDIAGFTRISEQVLKEPRLIGKLVNTWSEKVVEIVWRTGGVFDKMVGDCVIGIFGTPFDDRSPAECVAVHRSDHRDFEFLPHPADLLAEVGGRVDRIEVCPHGPDEGCDCRKPAPGLLVRLLDDYGVDPADVFVVGDSLRDLEAALAANAKPVLVRTGNGRQTEQQLTGPLADIPVFDDLAAFATRLTEEPSCC